MCYSCYIKSVLLLPEGKLVYVKEGKVETGAYGGEEEKEVEDKKLCVACACVRVLTCIISSTLLARPKRTGPDLTSHEFYHNHQTSTNMLIIHLITATPSVAFLCSRPHICIFLGSYRKKQPGSVDHCNPL